MIGRGGGGGGLGRGVTEIVMTWMEDVVASRSEPLSPPFTVVGGPTELSADAKTSTAFSVAEVGTAGVSDCDTVSELSAVTVMVLAGVRFREGIVSRLVMTDSSGLVDWARLAVSRIDDGGVSPDAVLAGFETEAIVEDIGRHILDSITCRALKALGCDLIIR